MAIIRGPDGKPIGGGDEGTEATTRKVERRSIKDRVMPRDDSEATAAALPTADAGEETTNPGSDAKPTEPTGGPAPAANGAAPASGSAGGSGSTPTEPVASPPASDEPATQIVGARRRSAAKEDDSGGGDKPGSTARKDPMDDPVVGWVVIVKGPGQGASISLGYGMNGVGRASAERICLDFGDEQISRTQHATITYDPRGRKYFVAHGGGKNLTYLGEDPVLVPVELKGGEEIVIGETTLRFVPFCGEDFDWRDK